MVDRQKIIEAFDNAKEELLWLKDDEYTIGYNNGIEEGKNITLVLLKEQEAVEPKQVDLYGKDEWWSLVCVCPDCSAEWMSDKVDTHFCPKCGRPVKWE